MVPSTVYHWHLAALIDDMHIATNLYCHWLGKVKNFHIVEVILLDVKPICIYIKVSAVMTVYPFQIWTLTVLPLFGIFLLIWCVNVVIETISTIANMVIHKNYIWLCIYNCCMLIISTWRSVFLYNVLTQCILCSIHIQSEYIS